MFIRGWFNIINRENTFFSSSFTSSKPPFVRFFVGDEDDVVFGEGEFVFFIGLTGVDGDDTFDKVGHFVLFGFGGGDWFGEVWFLVFGFWLMGVVFLKKKSRREELCCGVELVF